MRNPNIISSNINEVIRPVLNVLLFFYEKISHVQKAQKTQNANKQLSLRCFLIAQKAQKTQKVNKRLLLRRFICIQKA